MMMMLLRKNHQQGNGAVAQRNECVEFWIQLKLFFEENTISLVYALL